MGPSDWGATRIRRKWQRPECPTIVMTYFKKNISGSNQSLYANRVNFNLSHRINSEGGVQGEWEGGFAKVRLEAGS